MFPSYQVKYEFLFKGVSIQYLVYLRVNYYLMILELVYTYSNQYERDNYSPTFKDENRAFNAEESALSTLVHLYLQ